MFGVCVCVRRATPAIVVRARPHMPCVRMFCEAIFFVWVRNHAILRVFGGRQQVCSNARARFHPHVQTSRNAAGGLCQQTVL